MTAPKDEQFDLEMWVHGKWREMEKRFSAEHNMMGLNALSANKDGMKEGFNKACEVILEEAEKVRFYDQHNNQHVRLQDLKQIIERVRG
jgi:hypothetical protein